MQQQFPQASHNSDPASSHIAERKITESGRRENHARRVLRLVAHFPGRTPAEIADLSTASPRKTVGLDRYQVAKRLSDLKALGKVERGPMRTCRVLGSTCATWRLA